MTATQPVSITEVNVSQTSGTFLVRTKSSSIYTITCLKDADGKIFVSGGSQNRPAELVTLKGGVMKCDDFMVFGPDSGWSTNVTAIYDITGLEPHEVALLGKEVL